MNTAGGDGAGCFKIKVVTDTINFIVWKEWSEYSPYLVGESDRPAMVR